MSEISCECCGMTIAQYKAQYPLKVQIAKINPYHLPVGKEFDARLKEGNGSPFPVIVAGNWPNFFHGRTYQLKKEEVNYI